MSILHFVHFFGRIEKFSDLRGTPTPNGVLTTYYLDIFFWKWKKNGPRWGADGGVLGISAALAAGIKFCGISLDISLKFHYSQLINNQYWTSLDSTTESFLSVKHRLLFWSRAGDTYNMLTMFLQRLHLIVNNE